MKKIVLNKEGKIIFANNNFLNFFGVEIQEIILKKLDEIGVKIYYFKNKIDPKKENVVFLLLAEKSAKVIIKKKAI